MTLASEPTHQHDTGPEANAPDAGADDRHRAHDEEPLAEDEVLLEEISIDGMCGVY